MDLNIREENQMDVPFILELINVCFLNKDVDTLISLLRNRKSFTTKLSFVAEENHKIIGYILLNPIELKTETNSIQTVWLEPICVNPTSQGNGIGTKLMNHCINKAKELGFDSIFVTGETKYYSKYGFCKADIFGISPSISIRPDAFLVLELKEKSLPSKGKLIYPEEIFG
jgi:predicted N-acetyltransferase YhbS